MGIIQTNHRFALARYNPNGALDNAFSSDGLVTTVFSPVSGASAYGLPTDRAGRLIANGAGGVVVAGRAGADFTQSKFAVARFTSNGALDNAFSNDGKVTTGFANPVSWITDVAIDAAGRIVSAGSAGWMLGGGSEFAVARYTANGTLDNTFSGADGRLTTAFPGTTSAFASAVAIDANGRIVVAGHVDLSEEFPGMCALAVARYTSGGVLDNTFSGDGRVTTQIPGAGYERINDLAIDANGRIVVAGSAQFGGNDGVVVARYTSAGTLDTTFSGNGWLATAFPGADWAQADAVAIDGQGRIVVAGYAHIGGNRRFAVARYLSSGILDTTFSGDGRLTTTFPGTTSSEAHAVAIDANGRIVVAGAAKSGDSSWFAVARYTSAGILDTAFSGDGRLMTTFPTTEWADAQAVAIDANGRIVVAGSAADLEEVPDPEPVP